MAEPPAIGVVCDSCDAFNEASWLFCALCGAELSVGRPPPPVTAGPARPEAASPDPTDPPMHQAKYFVCESCRSPVPSGHKFCVRCGATVPELAVTLEERFFSAMQDPRTARLMVIRSVAEEGVTYHLEADQHRVGRDGADIVFTHDPFISPVHANFFYRDGQLHVRDERSLNGVYVRVRGTVTVQPGACFIVGEQLFRLDLAPPDTDGQEPDDTLFYSSPREPLRFRVIQMLAGGADGMTVGTSRDTLRIGREDGDLNFPSDLYMSAEHCTVVMVGNEFTLTDHESRNGTYLRIASEVALTHGDYVYLGSQLLRVELNAS